MDNHVQERTVDPHSMLPGLRTLGPQLIVAGVLPVVGYALLRRHVASDAEALAAVMVFPAGEILFERVRRGRFEPIGIISLIGITAGLIGALVFHGDAMLLKLRESVFTGMFGLVCLASLLARRPVMFYLGRAFATAGRPERTPEFDEMWELPGAARRFRLVTAAWGTGLAVEAAARVGLALDLSTQTFLVVAPIASWGVIGVLFVFTRQMIKSGERAAGLAAVAVPVREAAK